MTVLLSRHFAPPFTSLFLSSSLVLETKYEHSNSLFDTYCMSRAVRAGGTDKLMLKLGASVIQRPPTSRRKHR